MALGTITNVAIDPHSSSAFPVSVGDLSVTSTTVVGDSSYPTGGTALTGLQLGLKVGVVLFAICTVTGSASNNAAVGASYNVSTGKLQMWSGTTYAETGNGTNVSGLTITVNAFGY